MTKVHWLSLPFMCVASRHTNSNHSSIAHGGLLGPAYKGKERASTSNWLVLGCCKRGGIWHHGSISITTSFRALTTSGLLACSSNFPPNPISPMFVRQVKTCSFPPVTDFLLSLFVTLSSSLLVLTFFTTVYLSTDSSLQAYRRSIYRRGTQLNTSGPRAVGKSKTTTLLLRQAAS